MISERDFRAKKVSRDKEGHFTSGDSSHQEGIIQEDINQEDGNELPLWFCGPCLFLPAP
jgi:hypothetical protein